MIERTANGVTYLYFKEGQDVCNHEMILPHYQCLLPSVKETTDCIKKYGFIETVKNKRTYYINGFTEIRKLGNARYTIRHEMNNNHHVTNIEDMETYVKNFLRLNGY